MHAPVFWSKTVPEPHCGVGVSGIDGDVIISEFGVGVVGVEGCKGTVGADGVCGVWGLVEVDLASSDITCAADGDTGEPSGE